MVETLSQNDKQAEDNDLLKSVYILLSHNPLLVDFPNVDIVFQGHPGCVTPVSPPCETACSEG